MLNTEFVRHRICKPGTTSSTSSLEFYNYFELTSMTNTERQLFRRLCTQAGWRVT
ncbi:hypothetical protein M378DRAFT_172142 [Amanita muscaria Koide BX008]|uniref:Uncharacterized protein n=1 Tax=Amanita muscaria (strain Koide BX008) TaxID=946122 RepID=A0A0C2S370_AMAMK|nr:hypothetical protein M378DRAFT_172142 [Amanita muscaria Koide BX008]